VFRCHKKTDLKIVNNEKRMASKNNSTSRQHTQKKKVFRSHRRNILNITIDSRLLNDVVCYTCCVLSL